MSTRQTLRSSAIIVILFFSILTGANFAAQLSGSTARSLLDIITPANAVGGIPVLGIDCGVGTSEGIANPTGPPAVIGDGTTIDTSCNWSGDADALTEPDALLEPLVSDNPASAAFLGPPATGGGFSAEVRLFNLPPPVPTCPHPNCINGFDVAVRFDPKYLNAQLFDQRGLPFGDNQPPGTGGIVTLATLIDNINGVVRLAQVINGVTVPADANGGITLFRVRFDVVGVGTSPLHFPCDAGIGEPCQVTNPGNVALKIQDGGFISRSFFDVLGTLSWDVSWSFSPNPMVPGSDVTFTASASCTGSDCGSTLSYSWDFDTDGTIDATTNPVTVTNPPVSRATLIVNDGAGHIVTAVRRPPLVVAIQGPASLALNATGTFSGFWLGGNPPYSGNFRFCPTVTIPVGTGPVQVVCTNAAPAVPATGQTSTQTVVYRFAGTYANTLLVRDTASREIPLAAVTSSRPVTVTGAKPAYTVTITNPGKATVSTSVPITVSVAYFGDMAAVLDLNNNGIFDAGETVLVGGTPPAGTALKDDPLVKYRDANNNNLRDGTECVFYDNNNNVLDAATDPAITGTCPGTGTPEDTDTRLRYVDTNNNNILDIRLGYPFAPRSATFSYVIEWGDGLQSTVSGGFTVSASHTYTATATYTIRVTAQETGAAALSKIQEVGTSSIIINTGVAALCAASAGGCDFTVSPASPTAGQSATFTVTVNGGTAPYQCSFSFGDGTSSFPAACSTGSTFTHTYANKGPFNAVLTITDSASGSSTVSHSITVQGAALVADFTFSPAAPTSGKAVTFTAAASGGTAPYTFSWAFGDTTSGTGSPVSHTYAAKGSFSVVLTVTDANQATVSVTKTVVVAGQPLAGDFTFSPATPASGQPVTFTASATGGTGPYMFSWDFGDGVTGTGSPVTHTYTVIVPTTFTVTLTAEDANNVVATATHTVSVSAVSITVTVDCGSATAGKAVTCGATASGGIEPVTFSWSAPSGSPSSGTGASFTTSFATKGSQTVTVTAVDSLANTGSGSATVTVSAQPLAASVTCGSATAGKPVTCSASVTGGTGPYAITWIAVNGNPSTGSGATFTTTFATKGTQGPATPIGMSVTDSNGATASVPTTIVVAAQPLVADFVSVPKATTGDTVTFTATVSGGTTPYQYSWSFGDDTTGSGNPASHSYASTGTFQVLLTVTDANGASTTATHEIIINEAGQPLAGDFTFTPATSGKPVSFTATASGGTPPYEFQWDFGDGETGTGSSVSHSYSVKGVYEVTLTISDSGEESITVTHSVSVTPQPLAAEFSFTPQATVGGPVDFEAAATGGTSPYSFSWSFGDDTSGTGSSTSHAYSVKGSYTVTLTVTDANSATVQVQHAINVLPRALVAEFTIAPSPTIVGAPVTFTATVTGGTAPYSFAWSFGDETTGSGNPAAHTYSSAGDVTVQLVVTDANGATSSVDRALSVQPSAVGEFLLTFVACDADAFDDGVGELSVFINGDFVVNIPAGLHGLTGTGRYAPYDGVCVSFGPFDITSSVQQGLNTLTFRNPLSSHSSQIRNVKVVQGDTVLLFDSRSRNVSPDSPKTVTFSVPPLVLTSFQAGSTAFVSEPVTFTATFTGGTAPFKCTFSFGDGSRKSVTTNDYTCSVTHTYWSARLRTATVRVRGAAFADNIRASLQVRVAPQPGYADNGLTWDREIGLGDPQTFTVRLTNPASMTVLIRLDLTVTRPDRSRELFISPSFMLNPGQTLTGTFNYLPTSGMGTYCFSAPLSYGVDMNGDGVLQDSEVLGHRTARSGCFTVDDPDDNGDLDTLVPFMFFGAALLPKGRSTMAGHLARIRITSQVPEPWSG